MIARTDARQAESLAEALWRAAAFADAGADALFIDALESVDEMRAFTRLGGAAAALPKVLWGASPSNSWPRGVQLVLTRAYLGQASFVMRWQSEAAH